MRGAAHPPASVTEQEPVTGEQHEPEPGHKFGLHVPPLVHVFGLAQAAGVSTEQAPVTGEQHEPVAIGHGFGGPHVRPPVHVFVPEQ